MDAKKVRGASKRLEKYDVIVYVAGRAIPYLKHKRYKVRKGQLFVTFGQEPDTFPSWESWPHEYGCRVYVDFTALPSPTPTMPMLSPV